MLTQPFFSDGYVPPEGKMISVLPEIGYPFANRQVPDTTSRTFKRVYLVEPGTYTPRLAVTGPRDTDPDNATAYLAAETDPVRSSSRRGTVERVFAHIPASQVSYDTRAFARPPMNDLKLTVGSTTAWAVSFDDLATSWLFFEQKAATIGSLTLADTNQTVTADALPSATITVGKTAGGTTTFSTTDSASTIQSTLASAFGSSVYVTKANNRIVAVGASIASSVKYLDAATAGLDAAYTSDGTTGEISISATNQTRLFDPLTPTSVRTVTSIASGAAVGDWAVLWLADKIIAIAKVLTTPTADTFTVAADEGPLAVGSIVISKCQFAKNGLRLVNGSKDDCTIKTTENFYLPGVTTGITTAADIPAVPLYADAIGWLGRILATTLASVTAATATDRFNKTAHGLSTGDTFFLLAKTGGSGVALLTQYWAIRVDADYWKAASSPANALAGTAVAVGSDATGVSVLVPAPYAAIAVSALRSWMGPILTKATDEAQLADALETRSASA